MILVSSQTAFAYPHTDKYGSESNKNPAEVSDTYDNRSGSYSYVDLGTVTNEYSSDEVIASVSVLSRIITLGSNIPAKVARFLADKLFKDLTDYKESTLYFTTEVHTTQVFLDGEFVYYILDTKTVVWGNPERSKFITSAFYSGESLSPASLLPEDAI